jgi:glycogen debranching enzyme
VTGALITLLLLLAGGRLHAGPPQGSQATPAGIASLGVRVTGASREYSFTNKESAFLYGETHGPNRQSGQGFNVFGHEFLDDYLLLVDGVPVDRASALVTVAPDVLVREYPGGLKEVIRMTDSLAALAVSVSSSRPVEWSVLPLFADARTADAFVVSLSSSLASLARAGHPMRTSLENYPAWLTIAAEGFTPVMKSSVFGGRFSPVELHASRSKKCTIVFSVGDTREASESNARLVAASIDALAEKRRARMERLLAATDIHTGNDAFDRAFRWAVLSLDALIMHQVTKGIFAGLPWFNNYWGRDSFISLPGATLVTGQFAEARSILRSFAEFQHRDSASTDYGRIPNIVTTSEKAYNTADGTPRFVMMVEEYVRRSGDSLFLLEMYPTVLRAIEGTLRYHCDSLGFLTHRDAETWMDAVGPDGPWSPRGNRANDIQALWAGQLSAGIEFATRLGDPVSAREWNDRLTILRKNFPAYFIVRGEVADRLTPEGKPDMRLRPNQIFTCPLLDDSTRARVVEIVTSRLTYPYGVASLSQDDPGFHPYHQYPSSYPKDAAYHNGSVWTWLQGRVISELCGFQRQDLAYRVTANTVHQILDRGAVGTQSELLDAIARPSEKEPRLSGTFSQAWNLAEFIRNFYDDFLGIRLDRARHLLTIVPRVPEEIGSISARINLDGPGLRVQCTAASRGGDIVVSSAETEETFIVRSTVRLGDGTDRLVTVSLPPWTSLRLSAARDTVRASLDDAPARAMVERLSSATRVRLRKDLSLATPALKPELASLRGPGHPLIPHSRILRTNPRAQLLIDATDPENDDTVYSYPGSPDFVPGSFDIRRLTVAFDSSDVYFTLRFRALSDPGWHPEYGTQLTFAAIALNLGDPETRRASVVGRNAHMTLDSSSAFDRVIFIGGGVQVEDASGTILGAYLPAEEDAARPMGNAREGTIRFAIPRSMLGTPSRRWRLTLLAGAQDDHGGSGLGEFRTVNRERGDWNGGGRVRPDQSNVYDRLTATPK